MLLESEIEGKNLVLYLDQKVLKKVPFDLFKTLKLPMKFASKNDVNQYLKEFEEKRAVRYTSYLLALRSYYSKTLKEKLLLKGYSCSDEIIEKFKKLGYLNDESWMTSFIKREIAKGIGPYLIYAKLKSKKVDESQARMQLKEYYSEDLQKKAIQKIIQKRKKKDLSYLYRKGFSREMIEKST